MQLPLVFLEGPWRLAMGLNALDLDDWLWRDDRFAEDRAERVRLLASHPDQVHAMLPEAEGAAQELRVTVQDWLRERDLPADVDPSRPPLEALTPLAQEDFCLMQRNTDGLYALTGAILCFPAHWRLGEKLGRPMREIHAPVPGFGDRLAQPTERFFTSLQVERPVWRANWSITDSPDLFQPESGGSVPGLDAENAGQLLWLRVERQTLRRLPETKAIVFTIRTFVRRMDEVARMPGVAPALAARLDEVEPGMAAYKRFTTVRQPLLAYLAALQGGEPVGGQRVA